MAVVSGGQGYTAILQSGGTVRFNDTAATGTETFVTYSFFDSWPTYASSTRVSLGTTTIEVISEAQRAAIRTALNLYAAVSGLTFIEVPGNATTRGDLVFGMVTDIPSYSGLAYMPYDGMNRVSDSLSGEVWLSEADVGNMTIGSWGFWVAMHEIGHGIGFKHTFEGDTTLAAGEDNTNFTVMTYNVNPVPTGLGTYDIQAAQYLYGTRTAANANGVTGSWDATTQRVAIAGGGTTETIIGTGWRDTIAAGGGNDSVNAGGGDDIVSGNDGNDTLSGANGDDTLIGGAGTDTLVGNGGTDTAVLSRPRWEYRFSGTSGSLTATGLTAAASAADGIDTLLGMEFIEANGVRVSTATAISNNLANATGTGALATAGQRRAITDFFTTSDPDGNAIANYRFVDRSTGGGRLVRVVGSTVTDLSATTVTLTAAELGSVFFEGGSSAGVDTIEVGLYDGREWSQPTISIVTLDAPNIVIPPNTAPVVGAGGTTSVNVGGSVAASSLFSVSDAEGNAIAGYEFRDANAGGGQLRLNGNAIGNGIVAISAAQLGGLTYVGGASAGSEGIEIRATDGTLWSNWTTVSVATVQPNRAPVVGAGTVNNVAANGSVAMASLFSVSDPDGNPITAYEVMDASGGGLIRVGGVAQASATAIALTPAQLASTVYQGGTAAGSEAVSMRAFDGTAWSAWTSVTVSTAAPIVNNTAPTITPATSSLTAGQWTLASALFTAADPNGNAITAYRFTDLTNANGYFWTNAAQAANTPLEIQAAQLGSVWFRASSTGATSDLIRVEAFDGTAWGGREFAINAVAANRTPTVVANLGASVAVGGSIAVSSIFTATDPDGDALTAYEIWDTGAGGGRFVVGGVAQASGQAIALTPAQMASAVYQGATVASSESLFMRAKDATTWSSWSSVNIATLASTSNVVIPPNTAPVVGAGGTTSVNVGGSVAASSLFSVSDAEGNAIAGYEFRDANAGGGQLRLNGNAIGNGIVAISAAQLGGLTYVGGASAGSEGIEIRATDGTLWSNWTTVSVATVQPNRAPVVGAGTVNNVAANGSVAMASLFSVSDPDGNPITAYEVMDASGGGLIRVGGVAQASATAIALTPAQLASTVYQGGTAAGSEAVSMRAFDGTAWSAWTSVTVSTAAPIVNNTAPTITPATSSLTAGQWTLASALFTAADPNGNAITAYRFTDLTNANGYFWTNAAQATNTPLEVQAAQLGSVWFRSASTGPASDVVRVEAFDGTAWGVREFAVGTVAANRAPTVVASLGASVAVGGSIAVSSIFTATDPDRDALTAYEIWDTGAGGGRFVVGGVAQASGQAIALTPAQMASAVYQGATVASSESLFMRAKDATTWSSWSSVYFATTGAATQGAPDGSTPGLVSSGTGIAAPTNVAPTMVANLGANATVGGFLAASEIFTAFDTDGDAIAAYEIWDGGEGGGRFRVGDIAQAGGKPIALTRDQFASTVYEGGAGAGSEALWARASDGRQWSAWTRNDLQTRLSVGDIEIDGIPDAPQASGSDLDALDALFQSVAGQSVTEDGSREWRAASGSAGTLASGFMPPATDPDHGVLAGGLR